MMIALGVLLLLLAGCTSAPPAPEPVVVYPCEDGCSQQDAAWADVWCQQGDICT